MWSTFWIGKSGNLPAIPKFRKESGKICLSLSEKGGEKVAASVTAKVYEISDTSPVGLGVTCITFGYCQADFFFDEGMIQTFNAYF